MWASVEILVATFVNNAIALGTFVRDTGPKKKRFKQYISPADAYARDKKTGSLKPGNGTTTMNSFAERTNNDKRGSIMGMNGGYGVSAAAGSDNKAGIIIRTDTIGSNGTLASTNHGEHDGHGHGNLHGQEEARDSVASSNGNLPGAKPRERDSQESLIPKPGIGQAMYFGTVMKTTEISVTVTEANEEDLRAQHDGGRVPQSPYGSHHAQIPREAPRIVAAGERGVARGTTKLLRSLPGKEEDV